MSTTIDQRVVEMRFDNQHFEKNVSTTMSTLEKLKQKLHFKGASKGLENVNAAAKKVDMDSLSKSVSSVGSKFSALEVMGVTALANLTNSAVNAGKRIVSALTFEPVMSGFQEYETQINAVQTILANTSHAGTTIDQVNEALNTLNAYADKTIYNFTEMTRNIGTFTAAGVDLQTSVDSIQGIANLAAVSGSTSQQASTAMYQLSQALAAGTVKLMDWNSVVNAGMGGKVFQDALIRTSELLGTGAKAAIDASGSFRESLTKSGWLTTEVLTETLKQFAGAYEEADLIAQGFSESQAKEIMKMAKTAEDAATKVKTFTQLWDVLKESAQSGWSQSWKLIIGDFEEAKSLLTPLADFLTGVINGMSDARNALLESALAKSFTDLRDKLNKVVKPVQKVNEALKDLGKVVDDVILGKFGNGEERFKALADAGYNYCEVQNKVNETLDCAFRYTQEQIDAQNKLLGVQKKSTDATSEESEAQTELTKQEKIRIARLAQMSEAQLKTIGYTEEQIAAIRELKDTAEKLGIPVRDLIFNLDEINGRWLLMNSFKNIGSGIVTVVKAIADAWSEIFPPATADQLFDIIAAFHKFSTYLIVSEQTAGKVTRTFKGLFALVDMMASVVGGGLKIAFDVVAGVLKGLDMDILDVTASIGDAIVEFRNMVNITDKVAYVVKAIRPFLASVADYIVQWVNALKGSETIAANISKLSTIFKDAFGGIKDWISGIKEVDNIPKYIIQGLVNGLKNGAVLAVEAIIELGKMLIESVKELLGIHSPSTEFEEIGENVDQGFILGLQNGASGIWGKAKEIFKTFIENVKLYLSDVDWGSVIAVSIVTGLGVGMLKLGNKIVDTIGVIVSPLEKFASMCESIGDGVKGFLETVGSSIEGYFKAASLNKKSKALMNFAIAIGILAGSVALLALVDAKGNLWGAIGAIGVLAAVMGGLAFVIGKWGPQDTVSLGKLSLALLGISASLLIVVAAFKSLSAIDASSMTNSLLALTGLTAIMVSLVAMTKLFDKDAAKVGTTLLMMSVAMFLMSAVVKKMAALSPSELKNGIIATTLFAGIVAGLVAMTHLFKATGSDGIAKTIKSMSVSIILLILAAKLMSMLDPAEVVKGGLGIVAFIGVIGLMGVVSNLFNTFSSGIGTTLLGMSAAIMALVITSKMLAHMDPNDMAKGIAGIAAFSVVIGMLVGITRLAGGNDLKGVGVTLLSMSLAIGILGTVSVLLGLIKTENLKKGITAVGALSVMMALLVASTKLAQECKGTIVGLAITIGVLAASIAALSFIDAKNIAKSTAAISTVMGMFAIMVNSTKSLKGVKMGPLIAMMGAVIVLAGVIAGLALLNLESTLETSEAISLLLVSMSAAMSIAGKSGPLATKAVGALTLMGLVVAELGVILGVMNHFNVNPSVETAKSLSLLIVSMSGALVLLGVAGAMGPAAFIGIGALATLITGIGTIIAAIGALNSEWPSLGKFLDEGIPLIDKIGKAIGSFFGNIVGGFASGVVDSFSTAIDSMVEGVNALSGIDPSVAESAKALAETMMILTAAEFIDGLTFWNGDNSIDDFAKQLKPFGEAIAEFSQAVTGKIDPTSVESAANAGLMLAKMADTIPNSGGKLAEWFGDNTLSTFGRGLKTFGSVLVDYASVVGAKGVNFAAVESSANAAKSLAELEKNLPTSGGKLTEWFGDNTLKIFAEGLIPFGNALVSYARIVGAEGVDFKVIESSANAAQALATLENELPNVGGKLSTWLFGEQNIATFGSNLISFGENFAAYASVMAGVDPKVVSATTGVAESLVELQNGLPEEGGWFSNATTLEDFGKGLTSFGSSFATYYTHIGGINVEQLSGVTTELGKLIKLASNIGEVDTKSMSAFGDGLSKLVQSGIEGLIGAVSNNASGVVKAIDNLVSGLVKAVSSKKTEIKKAFSSMLDDTVDSINQRQNQFKLSGQTIITNFVAGLNNSTPLLMTNIVDMMDNVIIHIQSEYPIFVDIGKKLILKMIDGIKVNTKALKKTFIDLLDAIVDTIKLSYSDFYKAGAYLVDGFAAGISSNAFKAEARAKAMADAAVAAAQAALGIQSPSRVFRDEVGAMLPAGMAEGITAYSYKAASASAAMATKVTDAATDAFDKAAFEKEINKIIGDGVTKGILKSSKKATTAAKKAAKATTAAWVEEQKKNSDFGLVEELAAWKRVQESYKEGSEERNKAVEEVKRVRKELTDANEEYYNNIVNTQKEATDKRKQLDEDYYSKSKELNEKLNDDIWELENAYEDALMSRSESLYNSYGLFDKVKREDDVSGDQLMRNLQGQLIAFEEWTTNINSLADRGLNTDLLAELREMGVSAIAEIKALNNLTDQQLDQYVAVWESKHRLAMEQAFFELDDMREETGKKVNALREEAAIELEAYKEEWIQNIQALNDETKLKLDDLKTAWMQKVIGLSDDTTSEFSRMAMSITNILGNSSGWSTSGANIIQGVLTGVVNNSSKLTSGIENVMNTALNAAKKVLGINSPSKEFAKIGRYSDEGLAIGLRKYAGDVAVAAEDVSKTAVKALTSTIAKISAAVDEGLDSQPTIRPVLDLSDIESGTAGLNALFSRNQAMSISAGMIRNRNEEIQNGDSNTLKSGNVYTFTQNNYSPKALSRLEIYRQTKNQFSAMKGLVES